MTNMTNHSQARLEKARYYEDVTRGLTPVCYEWGMQNVHGAWYRLLREPHHTDQDIAHAESYLRNSRDVVSLTVEHLNP